MMAKKYIGNTINLIDWDIVIENLSKIKGEFRGYETPYERETSLESTELEYDYLRSPDNEIEQTYSKIQDVIEFYTFTPGKDYETVIHNKLEELIKCQIFTSWISKVDPGKCVAPHIDDEEIYWAQSKFKREQLVRYHVHISKPYLGAAFMIDSDCYYMEEQGSVYEWEDIAEIHCSMNAGTRPKYILHVIGVKDEQVSPIH